MEKNTKINQWILITGCSSGIGKTLAISLKKQSYQVIATIRKEQDKTILEKLGIQVLLLDLSCSKSVQQSIQSTLTITKNQLYAIIHNAAYGQVGALLDVSRAALNQQFQSNVFGWHELTNGLLPYMIQRRQGRIIYMSSILGFVAMPFRGAYNASKYAIEGLADTLRLELDQTGIQVSLIEPGPIESNFRDNAYQMFVKNIDYQHSDYQVQYDVMIKRLKSKKLASFTLPAQSILAPVIHALESKRAKIRYRVTIPTKLFIVLKRLLSSRYLDKVLLLAGGGGKR